jgi:hypothetical protein
MTKPAFDNIEVECWRHTRLGRAYVSLCVFQSAIDRGRPLLQALDELQAEAPYARRAVTFKTWKRKRAISTLRLRLVPPRSDLHVMNIAFEKGTATIQMTATGLQLLRKDIEIWCSGGEDFGVAPHHADCQRHELGELDKSSAELWFWGPTMRP